MSRIEIHLDDELSTRLDLLLTSEHRFAKNFCEKEIIRVIEERTEKKKGKWQIKPLQ